MKPGTPAPQFHLSDVNGEIHRLTDYKGKYLYISFISFNSPSSLAELEILAGLYPDYHHQIEFISIHVDELKPGWPQLIADYRINWALLLANDDLNVLEQYGATYPPVFVLLDPEGNILRYPAPNPSENLKTVLDSF
jgi:peroxiredoxin